LRLSLAYVNAEILENWYQRNSSGRFDKPSEVWVWRMVKKEERGRSEGGGWEGRGLNRVVSSWASRVGE